MAAKPEPNPPSTTKTTSLQHDPLAVQRGDYSSSSIPSSLLFTLGRAITGPIQYYIITRHPLQTLFPSLPPVPGQGELIHISLPGAVAGLLGLGATGQLSFEKLPLMCAGMPAFQGLKHIIWYWVMRKEKMLFPFAVFGVLADIGYELTSSLVFTTAGANPLWSENLFKFGFTLYISTVILELVTELQRDAFKAKPENKGKICKSGLWSVVRHINYTCNIVYGWGYGLACGGPFYSILTAGMYVGNLGFNATPSKEQYMQDKYGSEWEQYRKETKWKFFPGIW